MNEAYNLFDGIIGKMENVSAFIEDAYEDNYYYYFKFNNGFAIALLKANVEFVGTVISLVGGNYIANAPGDLPTPTIFNGQFRGTGSGRINKGAGWLSLEPRNVTTKLVVGILGNQGTPGEQATGTVLSLILYGTWK